MDPVSAFFFAAIVATVWVSDWCKDFRDGLSGNGLPRHERRMQQCAQEHELRKLRMQQRHAEQLAGVTRPRFGEAVGGAVADRVRRGPKPRSEMHGPRAWWFDLCADRAEQLTRQRREREARRAAGEQEWQKAARGFRDRYRRAGERAGQRWQERNAPRDPHRRWVDSERADRPAGTDWPDPNAHNPGTGDAQVVDDPQSPQPEQRRPELEPGWPEWGVPKNAEPETTIPPENPPGTVSAVAERIPKPLNGSPAGTTNQGASMSDQWASDQWHAAMDYDARQINQEIEARRRASTGAAAVPQQNQGPAALNGETVDPESLGGFASGMQQVAHAMTASIEASIANLETRGVSGGPINDLRAMADAAAVLAGRSQSAAQHAASHADIQGVAQSDPTVGGEQYLGIGAGRR